MYSVVLFVELEVRKLIELIFCFEIGTLANGGNMPVASSKMAVAIWAVNPKWIARTIF
jgi:hypothetical protein